MPQPERPYTEQEAHEEAEILAKVAAAETVAAQRPAAQQPKPSVPPVLAPAPVRNPAANREITHAQWQSALITAMNSVAGKITAEMPNLPPNERRKANIRADALSSCVQDLLAGQNSA